MGGSKNCLISEVLLVLPDRIELSTTTFCTGHRVPSCWDT